MSRPALAALLLAIGTASAAAQGVVFSAPTPNNVVASSEQSGGSGQLHLLYVTNRSSVPIVVFGVVLTGCENVRQWCDGRRENIAIPAGTRRVVARVEPRNPERPFTYRWNFSYRADSTDAVFIAVMKEQGMLRESPAGLAPDAQVSMTMSPVPPVPPVPPGRGAEPPPIEALPAADALPPLVASTDVDGVATATSAIAPTRQFFVTNKSAYPIVVYSFNLATCLNVRQVCGRTPVNVRIPARGRMQVGRVDAQERTRRYSYDWTYDWRLDTADVKVASALRARGVREGSLGEARNLAIQPEARQVTASVKERFRFRVARESILGATQAGGGPVPATGACIDPLELAAHERDSTILLQPDVAPRFTANSLTLPTLPPALRDSARGDVRVLVRWVVDSTGGTVPGSVKVLESPYGLVSVRVCGAVIGARLLPGRDAQGRAVRSWVEAPLRIRQ